MQATIVTSEKVSKIASKKAQLGKTAVVLLSALGVMSSSAQADITETIAKGVKEGKTTLNLRYRYENVDQDNIQKSATENIDKLKKELKVAEDNLNTGKSSESKVNSIKDKISQATEDRDRAKKEEEALRKKLKPIADKLYGE